jgi:hypothetical protein
VCLGDVPVVRQLGPRDTGCPHRPGEAVVCIEGFWSVRHAVEQLTEDRERSAPGAAPGSSGDRAEDRVTAIDVPPGNPLVCLGVGNDDLPARSLQKQLEAHFGAPDLRVLKEGDDPLEELLWKAASRPGLLIVISHLQPGDTANNLPARIAAVVSNPPFQPNVITGPGLLQQKLHFKEWTAPRSFVLLMACESAQVQLEQLTNLIDTFFGVGAGAVAGTETDVMSDLAADFARQIAIGLTGSTGTQTLGALVRAYTAAMFKSHNPLPFAFPVFGSADLTVRRVPS